MLNEMCSFIDCYAEYILGDKFEARWPEKPELRKKVYIENILSLRVSKNIKFLVYEPKSGKFTSCEKEKVLEEMSKDISELVRPLLNNPNASSHFYDETNKRLGSTSGLGSFFPFIFKVPQEENIDEKIEATKKGLEGYKAEEFKKVFCSDFPSKLKEEVKKLKERENYFVLILFDDATPYKEFLESEKILRNAITIKEGEKRSCQLCGVEGEVGYPVVGSSYDDKKKFLSSPTKGNGRISVCPTCGFKVNAFNKLLKASKDGVLPVFIDKEVTLVATRNIRNYLGGGESYSNFMKRIYEDLGKDEYKMAHYLMIRSGDIIWVDYVSSLRWVLEWKVLDWMSQEVKKEGKTRKEIGDIFYASVLKGTKRSVELPHSIYFDFGETKKKSGEMRRYERYLIYKYKDYWYRFIYKNEASFSKSELIEFINLSIAQKYYDALMERRISTFNDSITAPLEIFFNTKTILGDGGDKMKGLEELRKKFDEVIKNETTELDDAEWAFCAGAFYRYLISHSKSKQQSLELEPFINASSINEVLGVLTRTFERYQHEIKQPYLTKWGGIGSTALVPKDRNRDFEELKPFFYAGFADNMVFKKFYGEKD